MRMKCLLTAVGIGLLVSAASVNSAHADGFLSNLNPFASETKTSKAATSEAVSPELATGDEAGGWSLPLPPAPSLSGIATGTKRFATKTFDFLTPWRKSEPAPRTGVRTARQESSGWNWFGGGSEAEQTPQSPNDFLRMPRPDFD